MSEQISQWGTAGVSTLHPATVTDTAVVWGERSPLAVDVAGTNTTPPALGRCISGHSFTVLDRDLRAMNALLPLEWVIICLSCGECRRVSPA